MYMINKIYHMWSSANQNPSDLALSSSYLGLSSLVLFIFLFPFSNTSSLNCEDEAISPVGQVLDVLSVDSCDGDHQVQREALDSTTPSEQEELSTEEHEHCFEQDTHFDSIFEEWVRIEHHDGSYTYEYRYRYEYNYNYQYWYNPDKCVGPLPVPFPPNEPPVPLPFPHDGNSYPAPTP